MSRSLGRKGKLDKFDEARIGGMQYALRLVKANGLEAAEKELQMRCTYKIPIGLTQNALDQYTEDVKHQMFDTMKLVASMALRDSFGFGGERLKKFWMSFEDICEAKVENYITFQDLADTIDEECKVKIGEIRQTDRTVYIKNE